MQGLRCGEGGRPRALGNEAAVRWSRSSTRRTSAQPSAGFFARTRRHTNLTCTPVVLRACYPPVHQLEQSCAGLAATKAE